MVLVLAVGLEYEIGINNNMPWGSSQNSDLEHFRKVTDGGVILMGRKTFESIGRTLPNRCHMVVTQSNQSIDGCMTVASDEVAMKICNLQKSPVYLIGGQRLVESMIGHVTEIRLTVIESNFKADRFFNKDLLINFKKISSESFPSNEKNKYPYRFETWRLTV
jgi:dihydrofolate reductase